MRVIQKAQMAQGVPQDSQAQALIAADKAVRARRERQERTAQVAQQSVALMNGSINLLRVKRAHRVVPAAVALAAAAVVVVVEVGLVIVLVVPLAAVEEVAAEVLAVAPGRVAAHPSLYWSSLARRNSQYPLLSHSAVVLAPRERSAASVALAATGVGAAIVMMTLEPGVPVVMVVMAPWAVLVVLAEADRASVSG